MFTFERSLAIIKVKLNQAVNSNKKARIVISAELAGMSGLLHVDAVYC